MNNKKVSLSKSNRKLLEDSKPFVTCYIKALEELLYWDFEAFYGKLRNLIFCVDWTPLEIVKTIKEDAQRLQLELCREVYEQAFQTETGKAVNSSIIEKLNLLLEEETDSKVTFYFAESVAKDLQEDYGLFVQLKKCSGFVPKQKIELAEKRTLLERGLLSEETIEKDLQEHNLKKLKKAI